MRLASHLLVPALLVTQTVTGCDCESMLASRRRQGAPTTSEGRGWDDPSAAQPPSAPVVRARPTATKPTTPVAPTEVPPAARVDEPLPEVGRGIYPTRPGARPFDRLKPVKMPRNILPMQRFGGDPVEENATEQHELLDR